MSLRRAAALCALGALLHSALPRVAHAAPAESDRAQILFEQSETAYREGRFDEAISLLKEAYRLTPDPVVFYNLARAYEGKGDLEQAASSYERYLAEGKDIPDRGALEKKIETLKKLAAERKAAETAKRPAEDRKPALPPKDAKAPVKASHPSPVPWVIAGLGGAGTIAGAIVAGLAFAKNEDADAATSQKDTADLRASAEDMALAGNITMGVGGAILLAGTIWGIVDVVKSGTSTPESGNVRLRVGAGSVSFSIGFD